MPVPEPYRRFSFSSGFKVEPPPTSRFHPSSGKLMLLHNSSNSDPAQIGVGPLDANPCFRFDFVGASLGCNSTDLACVFNITALRRDGTGAVAQNSKILEVPACTKKTGCTLEPRAIDPTEGFSNLVGVNITLTVGGHQQAWWVDDIKIAWSDNSCSAGSCRSEVPNNIMAPASRFSQAVHQARGLLRWAVRGVQDE
ncbi:hypothetical protein GQ53DRAFT_747519, partial [Thozetella sp. PMI_491]